MSTPPAHPRIPYGEADFRLIRLNRWLYVDKTRFLRRLEQERYAFLIRPRRFGKSLWVSLLENYYDRFWADGFAATFAGTDIGQHPTGEQSRYVTLRFNFSMVNDKLETLEREFETYCMIELRGILERHPDLFPEAARRRILAPPSIAQYPHLRHGYLIELEYLKRSERLQRGEPAGEASVAAAVEMATAQLDRYLADERLARQFPGVRFIGLIVVFHGWEMVFCDAVRP